MNPADAAGLEVSHLRASYAARQVVHDLSFTIPPSRFLTLLGPSGCGKSTTLRGVAGLHAIDGGEIRIGDMLVAGDGVHVRPEHRRVNMVFQSYAIWPHMSVEENVAYGLRVARVADAEVKRRVADMLELVGLGEFANRPATGLSGGQQQRVALARALATRPRVLLLDEPLSNLDSVLRHRMRTEIQRIQKEIGITTLYVTHDCAEALSMSDEVIVMQSGLIAQAATPENLYRRPASRFVATFLGPANILTGVIEAVNGERLAVRLPGLADAPLLAVDRAGRDAVPAMAVELVVRPEHVTVVAVGAGPIAAKVVESEFLGSRTNLTVRSGSEQLAVEQVAVAPLAEGTTIALAVDPADIAWFPVGTDAARAS